MKKLQSCVRQAALSDASYCVLVCVYVSSSLKKWSGCEREHWIDGDKLCADFT